MNCPSCRKSNDEGRSVCDACGTGLTATGQLPAGYCIGGRYEIRRFLGQGGMGSVYEVFDRQLEDRVALKLLKAAFTGDADMARRFRHEIKLARKVRHPQVCAIHEYGEDGPHHFITMELIEGVDLKRRLRDQGGLPIAEAFAVSIQICEALDAIHRAGVIHRDLKTANVMIDARGTVRLMDFGIAKQFDATMASRITAAGSVIGSPEYMSPEQARGEPLDTRSDVYSLGIMIYEIFSGHVPFQGDTPIGTLFKSINEPPPLEGPTAERIPAALKPVLMKALAKSPADRHPSAEAAARAIEDARRATTTAVTATLDATPPPSATLVIRPETPTSPTPVTKYPPVRPQEGPRAGSRMVAVALAAAGVVLFLGAGIGGVVLIVSRLNRLASPPDPVPISRPTTTPVGAAVTAATPESAEASPPPPLTTLPSLVIATPDATRAATPPPSRPAEPGLLQLYVKPWAEVVVGGTAVGTTPLRPMSLPAGPHVVRLSHPAYEPIERRVVIRAGATTRLDVDLSREGRRHE